ncbi:MAG: hypothetical protein D6748_13505 [Calditrichaeota bacterium]|nr:MAG: hypothetical protein D6748_13505 [Calditrichota bacterium]
MSTRSFGVLFFLSGACGLMYQILWVRLFSILLGNTYLAISIIVSAFMFGLFVGSWASGKFLLKPQIKLPVKFNELQWYATLEILIGIYALILLFGFGIIESGVGWLFSVLHTSTVLLSLMKILTILILLLPPTAAMGATLPLVIQFFTRRYGRFESQISFFYAINTLGGAIGILLAGFLLIELLGIRSSIMLTAFLNLLIGGVILLKRISVPDNGVSTSATVISTETVSGISQAEKRGDGNPSQLTRGVYLATMLLSGVAALSYEMLWTRGLKFIILNSTYGFAAMLFIFLSGLAIGGFLAKKLVSSRRVMEYRYALFHLLSGIYALLTIYLLYVFLYTPFYQKYVASVIFESEYSWLLTVLMFLLTSVIIFLPPTIIMGVLFPLLNDLYYQFVNPRPGGTVSIMYAVNTVGAITGALMTGFLLIPELGIKSSIYVIAGINFLLGIIFLMRSRKHLIPTLLATVMIGLLLFPLTMKGKYLYGRHEKKKDKVLFYKEGLMSTVKVYDRNQNRYMSIDGVRIASTGMGLLQKQKLLAHLPFFLGKKIQNVLTVGLASGITTGSVALHPGVEKIDCVELIKPVFDAAKWFRQYNGDIWQNEKIHLMYDDIFSYLRYRASQYDLIISDGKIGSLNNTNTVLLSKEYYQLCRAHLNPSGMFIQWIPLTTPHTILKSLLLTMNHQFNHVYIFYFYPSDILMIATENPLRFDVEYIQEKFTNKMLAQELRPFHLYGATSILSAFIGEYGEFFGKVGMVNTLEHPRLEFLYMREWKKSRLIEGGYRAQNMEYFQVNYERLDMSRYLNPASGMDVSWLQTASNDFFKFVIVNFKRGNYFIGLKRYQEFKFSLYSVEKSGLIPIPEN